ncbi:MAG: metallophosphoesterase [Clostridia bacterium]|nr:metallophosphoesterase [Clostridia bacterium]
MDNKKIAFREDGRLTILQITDLHAYEEAVPEDEESVRRVIGEAKPDIIIMTGDNISGYALGTKESARRAIKNFMDLLEPFGIPVAAVFGNHDDDRTPCTKAEQLAQYGTYGCFIGKPGFSAEMTIGGRHTVHTGNYSIPVYESAHSDRIVYNLWCFDSGSDHADPAVDSYGYVFPEQAEWYVKECEALKALNGGKPVPSMVFQHISPPHIVRALKEVPPDTPGSVGFAGSFYILPDGTDLSVNRLKEAPCPPNTDLPEGWVQMDAMLKQGDVRAIFFGHDHINCFVLDCGGIDLVCSPGCGAHSYNDGNKGFRVITLDKARPDSYETYTVRTNDLLSGESPVHRYYSKKFEKE